MNNLENPGNARGGAAEADQDAEAANPVPIQQAGEAAEADQDAEAANPVPLT